MADTLEINNSTADSMHSTVDALPKVLSPSAIRWTPLGNTSSNFGTHKLAESQNDHRIEVVATKFASMFYIIFGVMGLAAAVTGIVTLSVLETIFGVVFIGFAYLIKRLFFSETGIFDKRIGWFWLGDDALTNPDEIAELKTSCKLSDIYALQFLVEEVSSSDSNYDCYELNLIKQNGDRVAVMRHGNGNSMRADSQRLSKFLGVNVIESY